MREGVRHVVYLLLLTLAFFALIPAFLHADPVIHALTPEHVGLTAKPQPTLYWYLSEPTVQPLLFTLLVTDGKSIQTMIAEPLPRPARPGVQRIRLKDYGITLREKDTYQWSVVLLTQQEGSTRTMETQATLEFLNCKGLEGSNGCSGFWYDNLEAISEAIEKEPGDKTLRAQRAELLKQGGLGHLVDRYRDLAE